MRVGVVSRGHRPKLRSMICTLLNSHGLLACPALSHFLGRIRAVGRARGQRRALLSFPIVRRCRDGGVVQGMAERDRAEAGCSAGCVILSAEGRAVGREDLLAMTGVEEVESRFSLMPTCGNNNQF